MVAIDESEHSAYALKWTLDHFFTPTPNPIFKLVLIHAKPSAISTLGLAGPAEVIEGDARNVLCDAVDKHHASILVVGSHAYGTIKRAVLGSVSDYCAHHAHCTVMIVKKPKTKH
ncbi:universal stress protein PHOS34-like [Senna tora]|uniref:Universal stress protein PHOS34-like n=1 Tax=Senna tora TaxID=362788 RepID=A0A834SWK2_9FABA|nr:universal stress protein PHOS34-like [Senna tora]